MLRKFRNVRWDDHPKLTSPNEPSLLKNSLPAKVRIGNLNLEYRSRESCETWCSTTTCAGTQTRAPADLKMRNTLEPIVGRRNL